MAQNQNNVILVNPNDALGVGLPADFKVAQPDDLTIFVELTTEKKSRSSIVVGENDQGVSENNTGTVGKVNFISGSPFGKNNSLTTSYTDIGSASLQNNGADLEGFGIESIDITFDTAYTPLIKIKFVDVRGGMFQRGNESKYSVFFELPYPLFNLKVKGYYGRTVSYCLHLVKWDSLFNSNTGNFEIDAEFIGYTFAILTDLLIGFMRAAPYVTGIGDSAFNSVKESYERRLNADGNIGGNQIITIDDMLSKITVFQGQLNQINRDSTAYKQLISVKQSVDVLNKIRKANETFAITLQKNNSVVISSQNNTNVGQSDIYYVVTEKKDDYNNYVSEIGDLIKKLEEFVDGISDSDKNLIKSAIKTNKLQLSDFIDQNGDFVTDKREVLNKKIDAEPKYDLTNDKDNIRVDNILNNIKGINSNPTSKNKVNGGFYIYDFIKFVRVMNSIISKNSKQQNELILKYQDELRGTLIRQFDFNPSVKNVFRILMASAETFLRSVQQVADNALNNTQRTETLEKITKRDNNDVVDGISDIKPSDTTIYPFPLYAKKETTNERTQIEEAWIGSNEVIDTSVVDEILYTEALLSKLITLKQADIDREVDLNNSVAWFSVNPLDTPINKQTLNPYYGLNIGGGPKIGEDYLRLLMYRTFTYLGLTNPYSLDGTVMEYMAKFEANNLFYGFPKSDYNSANKTNKTTIYDNYKDSGSIINHWVSGSNKIKNYLGNTELKPYMEAIGDNYAYRYIYSNRTSAAYIPISGGYTGAEFYDGDFLKTVTNLRGVDIDFLGNYVNSGTITDDKVDDGAKYLDIIPFSKYDATTFGLPENRAGDIIGDADKGYKKDFSDAVIIQNTLEGTNETTQFDPLSYKFYSNEFFDIKAENQPLSQIESDNKSDLSAAFIDNPDENNGTRLSELDGDSNNQNVQLYNQLVKDQGKDSIIVPDISFVSINTTSTTNFSDDISTFSLFGSPLYYAQNAIQDPKIRDYSKSYLFLNTLPLKGIYGKDDHVFKEGSLINGIFSKNGGFIKIPSLWGAWIGSVLWRYETNRDSGSDPILTKAYYGGPNNPISIVRASNDADNIQHYKMPTTEELFHSKNDVAIGTKAPMFFKLNKGDDKYKEVDKVLLSLPEQAKETFITFFKKWSDNSFIRIKKEYELLNDNAVTLTVDGTGGVDMGPWGSYMTGLFNGSTNTDGQFSPQSFESIAQNEVNVYALKNLDGFDSKAIEVKYPPATYPLKNFFLPYIRINLPKEQSRDDYNPAENSGNDIMRNIFADVSVIINYTPRTFNRKDPPFKNGRRDITIDKTRLETYLDFFTIEYQRLYDSEQNDEKDTGVREAIFNSNNTNFIKLNIYRHLKTISDKWVYDTKGKSSLISPCGDSTEDTLIDRFLFIDKNWEEIGDDFIINPIVVDSLIRNKYNQSLYDVISNILSQNNFNFIPLPNYVEYSEEKDMLENIFKPYPYVDMVKTSDNAIGPKFICMYVGQTSNHLDIKNSQYPDDSVDLNDGSTSLKDLKKVGKPIPAFEVNYGTQNQNFFKDLKLDQREFVETQESLEIIDRLSTSEDKNVASFASQNLFNVYQTRSYSAEITALGMPLIQPMMYFQLNNVPMFRGAYVIINTSHSIKPNHMTTTFKGIRVKKENTPINKQVIAIKDLDIAASDSGVKYNINDIIYDGSVSPNRSNSAGAPIVDIAATGDIYIDSFNKRTEDANNSNAYDFNRLSETKKNNQRMSYNQIFEEISQNTGFDLDILKIMAIMESNGGLNKGTAPGINSSGFVGLMQFGWGATSDVAGKINAYLQSKINVSDYVFSASLDGNKIKYPTNVTQFQWSKDDTVNNTTTNSMFDDYISALAGVYLAYRNISGLETNSIIANPVDIYIAHQQGKGGLLQIKNNLSRNISANPDSIPTNMSGNLPPTTGDKSRYVTNQDWYTGWAGNVDAAGYKINQFYESKAPFVSSFNKAKGASVPSNALTTV